MAAELDSEVAVLWESFYASRDPGARERLIARYAVVARAIAAALFGGRPDDTVAFDDYLQYARVGLIESIDRYDAMRGTSFESFAAYRIRGAVLNGVSRETELRARRSRRAVRLAEREESLAGEILSRPEEGASLEEFVRLTVGLAVGFILEESIGELVDESPETNPYAQAEVAQLRVRIRELVAQLPAREREVLQGHYYEQREFLVEVAIGHGLSARAGFPNSMRARWRRSASG